MARICKANGWDFPEHLCVQADNTTAQAKNAEVGEFLAVLLRKHKFVSVTLNFLQVGHTHEDVDQMFSILLALVLRRIRFQTPQELQHAIQAAMAAVVAVRGEELHVEMLSHIRNFKEWMAPLGIHLSNCFVTREGISAPHSFTYKFRMDLSHFEHTLLASAPGGRQRRIHDPPDALDVFCILKQFMSTPKEQCQTPVKLFSEANWQRMTYQSPQGSCYKKDAMTEERQAELIQLADTLEKFTETWDHSHAYFRAAQELRLLALHRDEQKSTDHFLDNDELDHSERGAVGETANPWFGVLPDISWAMKVSVKKGMQ